MQTSSVAVLFVHGIQGQPKQFQFLIDALPPELEVHAPMLPGHGSNAKAFHSSGRKEWLAAVRRETEWLLSSGKRVIYVGHSMGCLLGLKVSRELGDPYAGMLLLCCPFYPIITGGFQNGLRCYRRGRRKKDPWVEASRAANSVPVRSILDILLLARPYTELLRLIREIHRMEPKGPANIRFRFAEADRLVSGKSVHYAGNWPHADIRVCPVCSHSYFTEQTVRELRQDLSALLREAGV
ncbi:MAG: alpha/beta fold hydrolase [Oscillospiraceae bacterium]|nr:alpha/beta fold hydrolase [Oscillospiraceae bacterium]